jgi:nitric oxide reductase NorQ protein
MSTATEQVRKVTLDDVLNFHKLHGEDFAVTSSEFGWTVQQTMNILAKAEAKMPPTKDKPTAEQMENALNADEHDREGNPIIPMGIIRTKIVPNELAVNKINGYVKREIDKDVEDYLAIKDEIGNRNICLVGNAGTGKSTIPAQFACERGVPFLRISCDESSSLKTLTGTREIINGTTYTRTGLFLEMVQIPSIVLIDEFNALPASKLFFLHELLDARKIFVQDMEGGKVITLHKDCYIFLACNPANKNYGGTNKMNVALGNRCAIMDVPDLDIDGMEKLYDTGNKTTNKELKQYFKEAQQLINEKELRVALSIRNLVRVSSAIRSGIHPSKAIRYDFTNACLLTASKVERDTLDGIALRIFGK